MLNTGKLAGRTAFITGASRGIGLAIALKLARDGANIVIAAKTAEPHPKLPGTIYTAAKEVEAAGGKCLPCIVDIRYEDQVQSAVEQAVRHFGGLDILVNNASAISLTGTLETPIKRYDLMNNINARGTYLVSQLCLPYLKKGTNPHVLTLSPPLNMKAHWFKNHVAYTIAKYGMSMCTLGMAEEFRSDNIAVNALWPATAIATAAMEMIGGKNVAEQCRKPDIMADAAYVILSKDSHNFTGNFCIDEDVLREVGVTDLDPYAFTPGRKNFIPDFFLDALTSEQYEKKLKDSKRQLSRESNAAAAESESKSSVGGDPGPVDLIFTTFKSHLNEELVQKTGAIYSFELSGTQNGKWFVDLKNGTGSAGPGEPASGKADVIFSMKDEDFEKMFSGKMKPTAAYMTGKLKIKGDVSKALKLDKVLALVKAKL